MKNYTIEAIVLNDSDQRIHMTEKVSAHSEKQAGAYFITKNKMWRTRKGGKKYAKGLLEMRVTEEEIHLPVATDKPTLEESLAMMPDSMRKIFEGVLKKAPSGDQSLL